MLMWWKSAMNLSFFLSFTTSVCAPAPVTRFPGSVPGPCFAGSRSPWPPPFAPPAPLRSRPLCSSASQLLWQSLTSRDRASSATAPRLPDADRRLLPNGRSRDPHRFPRKERLHISGSLTTPGRPGLALSRPDVLPSTICTALDHRFDDRTIFLVVTWLRHLENAASLSILCNQQSEELGFVAGPPKLFALLGDCFRYRE